MWAGAGRDLLRAAPQGHRRKLSATPRGFREARCERLERRGKATTTAFGSQPHEEVSLGFLGFHPTLEQTRFQKSTPQ